MLRCLQCDSADIHRSRARSLQERLRRHFTAKQLFRCHRCGWRGWGNWIVDESRAALEADGQVPNLAVIDDHLERPETKPDTGGGSAGVPGELVEWEGVDQKEKGAPRLKP